jgi:hypothetical protein
MKQSVTNVLGRLKEEEGWDKALLAKAQERYDVHQRRITLKNMPGSQDKVAKIYMRAWNQLLAVQGAGLEVRYILVSWVDGGDWDFTCMCWAISAAHSRGCGEGGVHTGGHMHGYVQAYMTTLLMAAGSGC